MCSVLMTTNRLCAGARALRAVRSARRAASAAVAAPGVGGCARVHSLLQLAPSTCSCSHPSCSCSRRRPEQLVQHPAKAEWARAEYSVPFLHSRQPEQSCQ